MYSFYYYICIGPGGEGGGDLHSAERVGRPLRDTGTTLYYYCIILHYTTVLYYYYTTSLLLLVHYYYTVQYYYTTHITTTIFYESEFNPFYAEILMCADRELLGLWATPSK